MPRWCPTSPMLRWAVDGMTAFTEQEGYATPSWNTSHSKRCRGGHYSIVSTAETEQAEHQSGPSPNRPLLGLFWDARSRISILRRDWPPGRNSRHNALHVVESRDLPQIALRREWHSSERTGTAQQIPQREAEPTMLLPLKDPPICESFQDQWLSLVDSLLGAVQEEQTRAVLS